MLTAQGDEYDKDDDDNRFNASFALSQVPDTPNDTPNDTTAYTTAYTNEAPLSNGNKAMCIIDRVRYILLGGPHSSTSHGTSHSTSHRGALNCMRRGFQLASLAKTGGSSSSGGSSSGGSGGIGGSEGGVPLVDITSHLTLFSADELMNAVFGEEILSSTHFDKHLRYGEDVGDTVKYVYCDTVIL